jgi:hypothetical protein
LRIHTLTEPAPDALEQALAQFEHQFLYPLGENTRFRISHCGQYGRFFRAMGEAACFTAEHQGEVVGVLGTAVRRLIEPDGRDRRVAYVGDLKIAPGARGGIVLARLAGAAREWLEPRVDAAVGIAMDGTRIVPTGYTGRAGVPQFAEAGRITILRLPAGGSAPVFAASLADAAETDRRLSRGRYAFPVEDATLRSEMMPVPLVHPGGACGLLEDTRRAKRLFAETGQELLSAHLSAFAFSNVQAGAALLASAMRVAREAKFDAVFVSVPGDATELMKALPAKAQVATATIYAANLAPGTWNVNTAEI